MLQTPPTIIMEIFFVKIIVYSILYEHNSLLGKRLSVLTLCLLGDFSGSLSSADFFINQFF